MMSCKVMLTLNVSILNGEVGGRGISGDRVCQTSQGRLVVQAVFL